MENVFYFVRPAFGFGVQCLRNLGKSKTP